MKKEVMELWVAALRSGKYEQGREFLRSLDNKFCCLGVLCDVLKEPAAKSLIKSMACYAYGHTGNTGVLPFEVMNVSGMGDSTGTIKFKKGRVSLVDLNDGRRRSFKQIATYIERNWKKL